MSHRRQPSTSSNSSLDHLDVAERYYEPSNPKTSTSKIRSLSMTDMTLNFKSEMNPYKTEREKTILEDVSSLMEDLEDARQQVSRLHLPGRRPSIIAIDHEGYAGGDEKPDIESTPKANVFKIRRNSINLGRKPRKFYIPDVDATIKELLDSEDTDHNYQITIEDTGPKVLKLGTVNSKGYQKTLIYGTYMLSNLLQELIIAKQLGRKELVLDEGRLNENPVKRLLRLIRTQFWKSLTRQLNKDNILDMAKDTKMLDHYVENGIEKTRPSYRIYVPFNRSDQYEYLNLIRTAHPEWPLIVDYLPEKIDAKFIKLINFKPGLLALLMYPDPEDPKNLVSQPYVVPGGRFNELYGWDSYMETLGLLTDVTRDNQDHLSLARGMAENFIFEINHYGKILNANRLYYLGRSQPPFLTDMTLRIFNITMEVAPEKANDTYDFLKRAMAAAIKEYHQVWVCEPRLDVKLGLSCYHPMGVGVPPETEATHFDSVLKPYMKKYDVSREKFIHMYNDNQVTEPELDEYFLHDRAVRELGHDTLYRLEGKCAYLATVDLNSLLYKYETDIAFVLDNFYQDGFDYEGVAQTAEMWLERAHNRRDNINIYLWNEKDLMYYDYHIKTKRQTGYELATAFWPLWAQVATDYQAKALVTNSLRKLEEYGGLVAGTLRLRGEVTLDRPLRQWDYPYGWAPHQLLSWIGLNNYGYDGVARRLAYKWLYMMTKAFVNYNGVVVEKYNVTDSSAPQKVDAEYGNQGLDFKGVATEGFGWVNASYLFGLSLMNTQAVRLLGAMTPPPSFLRNLTDEQRLAFE